jgi:hypothetical protein
MGHRVTVLVLPGVLPLEFGIAAQIFGTDPHYELTVCAAGPVHGDGFCVTASAGLGALAGADTVVVPGYRDIDARPPGGVLAAAPGWSPSARPPSPWPRPACSTAGRPPPTGRWQTDSSGSTRLSTSGLTASTWMTGISSPRPE